MRPKPGTDIISKRWSDPSGITAQIHGPGGITPQIQGPGGFNPYRAQQDTIGMRVNPAEASVIHPILKSMGGAGRVNPATGNIHYYKDPMGDSSDPESSNYAGGMGESAPSNPNDAWSRAYTAMGEAYGKWKASRPGIDVKVGDLAGWGGIGKFAARNIANQVKWDRSAPYGSKAGGGGWKGDGENKHAGEGGGFTGGYGTGGGITGTTIGGGGTETSGGTGSGMFPSVYADPVTGRLLYQSQSVGGTSNLSYADQQLLDQLQGTNVASQNITQQIGNLNRTIEDMKKAGGDTRYYEAELARLQGLQSQSAGASNPLLDYVNSGLQERVANEQLDNTVANQLRSMEQTQARRGLGVLGSPMTDQLRASLGLSTAQARNQNKLNAQDQAFKNRMNLMAYLKQSQNQDYTQDMGRTGIGMTLGDWENQRKIAETTMRNQNKQYQDMLDAQSDANMWGAIGDIAGSIDWGSIF